MNYWLSDNHDYAAQNAFYQLRGYLGHRAEIGVGITAEEILSVMDRMFTEENARLNKNYPHKARKEYCND